MVDIAGNDQFTQNLESKSTYLEDLQSKLEMTGFALHALNFTWENKSSMTFKNMATVVKGVGSNMGNMNAAWDKANKVMKEAQKVAEGTHKSLKTSETLLSKAAKSASAFAKALENALTGAYIVRGVNLISTNIYKLTGEINKLNASIAILNKSGVDTSVLQALQQFNDSIMSFDSSGVENFATSVVAMYKQTTQVLSQIATQIQDDVERSGKTMTRFMSDFFDTFQNSVNTQLKNTVSTTDALNAAYVGLQAGLKQGTQLTNAVTDALKLMTTQGGDASQIMTLLSQTMTAYGKSTSEAGDILGKLNELVNVGVTSISELQMGYGQLAVTASAANVDIDAMSGALAALTQNGYSTARAFTALNSLFNQIISGDVSQRLLQDNVQFKKSAVTFDATTIATKGLNEALKELYTSIGGNKQKLSEYFPDVEALGAVMALTGEKADTLATSIEKISKASVANLEKAFNIKIDQDKVLGFERVMKRISELMIRLGKLFAPIFDEGLDYIDQIASKAEYVQQHFGGIVSELIKLNLAIKAVGVGVGLLFNTVTGLLGLWIGYRVMTGKIIGDAIKVAQAFTGQAAALGGYNIIADKNVSIMSKMTAVVGQMLGLHTLEAKSINQLGVLEKMRVASAAQDLARKLDYHKVEQASVQATIDRYKKLKEIQYGNKGHIGSDVFQIGEDAKKVEQRYERLTKSNARLSLNDRIENRKQKIEQLDNELENKQRELEQHLKDLRNSGVRRTSDVYTSRIKKYNDEAEQIMTRQDRYKKQVKNWEEQQDEIKYLEGSFDGKSSNLKKTQKAIQRQKWYEDELEVYRRYKERGGDYIDSVTGKAVEGNKLNTRLKLLENYEMGRTLADPKALRQEVTLGETAERAWEWYTGDDKSYQFVAEKVKRGVAAFTQDVTKPDFWKNLFTTITKGFTQILGVGRSLLGFLTKLVNPFTIIATTVGLWVTKISQAELKSKEIAKNMTYPVEYRTWWEKFFDMIVAGFDWMKRALFGVAEVAKKTISPLQPLLNAVGNLFGKVRDAWDLYDINIANKPINDYIESRTDEAFRMQMSTMRMKRKYTLNNYDTFSIEDEGGKNKRNLSINTLSQKTLSGKLNETEAQDFGTIVGMQQKRFKEVKKYIEENTAGLQNDYKNYLNTIDDEKVRQAIDTQIKGLQLTKDQKEAIDKLSLSQRNNYQQALQYGSQLEKLNKENAKFNQLIDAQAKALDQLNIYAQNLAKSNIDPVGMGNTLKGGFENSVEKLRENNKMMQDFLKDASLMELSKLSPEEQQKRAMEMAGGDQKAFDKLIEKLKLVGQYTAQNSQYIGLIISQSNQLVEMGYMTADEASQQLKKVYEENLKNNGALDPQRRYEYLQEIRKMDRAAFEERQNMIEKEKALYDDLYDTRYKKHFEYLLMTQEKEREMMRNQIAEAKRILTETQKDKNKTPQEIALRELDVKTLLEQYDKLIRSQTESNRDYLNQRINDVIEFTKREIALYDELRNNRIFNSQELNAKLREIELRNIDLDIKTKRDLYNKLAKDKNLNDIEVSKARLAVQEAENAKMLTIIKHGQERVNEENIKAERKYNQRFQMLRRLQIEGFNVSKELQDLAYDLQAKKIENEIEGYKQSLEYAKKHGQSTLLIEQEIMNKRFERFNVLMQKQRNLTDQNLQLTNVLVEKNNAAYEKENQILNIRNSLLSDESELLNKRKTILDSIAENTVNALQYTRGIVKSSAAQFDLDKRIAESKYKATMIQLDLDEQQLKIEKEQRDLQLEQLEIQQKINEEKAKGDIAVALLEQQSLKERQAAGENVSEVELLKADQRVKQTILGYSNLLAQGALLQNKRQMNDYQSQIEAAQLQARRLQAGSKYRQDIATSTLNTRDDIEAANFNTDTAAKINAILRAVKSPTLNKNVTGDVQNMFATFLKQYGLDGISLYGNEKVDVIQKAINDIKNSNQYIEKIRNKTKVDDVIKETKIDKQINLNETLNKSVDRIKQILETIYKNTDVKNTQKIVQQNLEKEKQMTKGGEKKDNVVSQSKEQNTTQLKPIQTKFTIREKDRELWNSTKDGGKITFVQPQHNPYLDEPKNKKQTNDSLYKKIVTTGKKIDNYIVGETISGAQKLGNNLNLSIGNLLNNVNKGGNALIEFVFGSKVNATEVPKQAQQQPLSTPRPKRIEPANGRSYTAEELKLVEKRKQEQIQWDLQNSPFMKMNQSQLEDYWRQRGWLRNGEKGLIPLSKTKLKSVGTNNYDDGLPDPDFKSSVENIIQTMLKLSKSKTKQRPTISFGKSYKNHEVGNAGAIFIPGENHILVNSGMFSKDSMLDTPEGAKLLIHELRHWMQFNSLSKGWLTPKSIKDDKILEGIRKGIKFSGNNQWERDAYTYQEMYANQLLRNLFGNDEPKDVASNLGRKIVAKPQSSENVTLFNPNQNPGYRIEKPKSKPEYPGGKPNSNWTKEEYYRYQKWVRDQNPFTHISFAPPEHLGITKSENESKNDTIMYNKSDSTLSQLQNNVNNKQFFEIVKKNVEMGKGGSMIIGQETELQKYLLDIAEGKIKVNKSKVYDDVQKTLARSKGLTEENLPEEDVYKIAMQAYLMNKEVLSNTKPKNRLEELYKNISLMDVNRKLDKKQFSVDRKLRQLATTRTGKDTYDFNHDLYDKLKQQHLPQNADDLTESNVIKYYKDKLERLLGIQNGNVISPLFLESEEKYVNTNPNASVFREIDKLLKNSNSNYKNKNLIFENQNLKRTKPEEDYLKTEQITKLNKTASRNTPSFRGQFEKNNNAVKTVSTNVGDIQITVNLNGTNNTQRDANNIAQTLEDKLYNIFNEVQMRGI